MNEAEYDDIARSFYPYPFVPSNESERELRCGEILSIQSAGLAKRLAHTGLKKAVIGISGGLDSTLALLVAVKAMEMLSLPNENIICVTMPGFGTTDMTYNNAVELIKALNTTFKEIDIKPACLRHMSDIGHDSDIHDITYEIRRRGNARRYLWIFQTRSAAYSSAQATSANLRSGGAHITPTI